MIVAWLLSFYENRYRNNKKDKINSTVGKSFIVEVQLGLSSSIDLSLGLRLDQYHSTFDHVRDLPLEVNTQSLKVINRKEITFHNNFTNTIGLDIGVNKKWGLFSNVYLSKGIHMTPIYSMSTSGKTTNDTVVESLSFSQAANRTSLQGGLNIGVGLPISNKLDLNFSYGLNRSI